MHHFISLDTQTTMLSYTSVLVSYFREKFLGQTEELSGINFVITSRRGEKLMESVIHY